MPFVERPNCSSTSAHSTWLQPWPPCSTACRPPLRRAATAARRTASTSASGSTPPARSAISSRGISSSSTKRRARSRSSAWAGVSSPAPGGLDQRHGVLLRHGLERLPCRLAPPAAAGQPEQQARPGFHHLAHDPGRVRDLRIGAPRPGRGELRRLAQPREVRRLAAAQDERLRASGLAVGIGSRRGRAARRRGPQHGHRRAAARAPAPGSARATPARRSAHARCR